MTKTLIYPQQES